MHFNTRSLALASIFAFLTPVGSLIAIPIQPVPITLQTFFTYLSGVVLGSRLGALSQLIYVMIGLLGLPVFAGGLSGPAVLLGPTGGYLIGFIFSSYVIGKIVESTRLRSFIRILLSTLAGTGVIYLFGVAQLTVWFNLYRDVELTEAALRAIFVGVLPFIPGDSIKMVLASYVGSRRQVIDATKRYLERR